jgi:hypothetical protein
LQANVAPMRARPQQQFRCLQPQIRRIPAASAAPHFEQQHSDFHHSLSFFLTIPRFQLEQPANKERNPSNKDTTRNKTKKQANSVKRSFSKQVFRILVRSQIHQNRNCIRPSSSTRNMQQSISVSFKETCL